MRGFRTLLLLCLLAAPTGARAGTVEVRFDLGSSTMSFQGDIEIPPDGSIQSMGATTILPAIQTIGGATAVLTGSAQLKDLTVDMTVEVGSPLFAFVFGTVTMSQLTTMTSPFTNTQAVVFGGAATSLGLSLFVSAHLNCIGSFCGNIGQFPVSIASTQPPAANNTFTLNLGNLNTPGAATVNGTIPILAPPDSPGGSTITGTIVLTGTEVSRTYLDGDVDSDGTLDSLDNCILTANPGQSDGDSDGAGDLCDNCLDIPNGPITYAPGLAENSQCDSDSDGYGNACDGDLDQTGFVTPLDNDPYLAALAAFIPPDLGQADTSCNGFMTPLDSDFYLPQLGAFLPGPSGWSCAGTVVGGCPPLP